MQNDTNSKVYVKANKDDTIRDAALKYFADLESR